MTTENCNYYHVTDWPEVPYNPFPTSPTPYVPYTPPDVSTKGWECPRCCTINAPWVTTCQGCSGPTITTSSIYFTAGDSFNENDF